MSKLFNLMVAAIITVIVACGCSEKPTATTSREPVGEAEAPAPVMALTMIIEAETMTMAGSFAKVDLDDASGRVALRIPEQAQCTHLTTDATPKPIGSLQTTFSTSAAATVNIWVRVKWTGTCSNSFTVVLPNGMKKTITSSTYNSWLWLPAVKNLKIESGNHTLGVDAREFGTLIDQVFITDDLERTPRGIETDYSTVNEGI